LQPVIKLSPRIINPNRPRPIDVLVELIAPPAVTVDRAPIDAVIVIDRSGSMGGTPLAQVKAAVTSLLRLLGPDDRIAVVTFDDEVDVVLPLAKHDPKAAAATIARIHAGGSTNLSGGWLEGLRLLTEAPRPGAIRRIITLTDGHANAGLRTVEELGPIVGGARGQGVTSSFIGFDNGYDERFLAGLADAGGGDDYWCDGPDKAAEVFDHEFGGLARVVAQNLRVAIAPTTNTAGVGLLQDLPADELANGGFAVSLGDTFGDEVRRVVLRLHPAGELPAGQVRFADVTLTWAAVGADPGLHTVTVPVLIEVDPSADDTDAHVDADVIAQVLELDAARAQREASEAADRGDWDTSAGAFRRAADRLEQAGGDPERVARLRRQADFVEQRQWDLRSRKEAYAMNRSMYKQRRTTFIDSTRDDEEA
jgi:Ca-activated chloride channel family protein